jgi:hypothetical protein
MIRRYDYERTIGTTWKIVVLTYLKVYPRFFLGIANKKITSPFKTTSNAAECRKYPS